MVANQEFSKSDNTAEAISLPWDRTQEMFLPIHDYVDLFPEEIAIIDLPAFQRLRRCRQLGFAHLLFPGATHTRFEHSVGTLHVAQRMIEGVNKNYRRGKEKGNDQSKWALQDLDDMVQMFIRLAALLHDIGHIPFGHTLEDELDHLDKHDGPDRIQKIADSEAIGYQVNPKLKLNAETPNKGWTLKTLINHLYQPYLDELTKNKKNNQSPFEILELIIAKPPKGGKDLKNWVDRTQVVGKYLPIEVCQDIVGNTICADFLDYLFRDWYHLGKIFKEDPRLYQYMETRAPTDKINDLLEWKFVINVGAGGSLRPDAITNILDLLEARYKLTETVLFHRTKLAATGLLDRCLLEIFKLHEHAGKINGDQDWKSQLKTSLVEALLSASDDQLPDVLKQVAFGQGLDGDHPFKKALRKELSESGEILKGQKETRAKTRDQDKGDLFEISEIERTATKPLSTISLSERADLINELLRGIQNRTIYTSAFRFGYFDLKGANRDTQEKKIITLYGEPDNRLDYLEKLEGLCHLPPGSLVMYCARDPKMNAKIAEVNLLIDNSVKTFKKYEKEAGDMGLTGGALKAQINRFRVLWSAQIYIQSDLWFLLSFDGKKNLEAVIKKSFLPLGNSQDSDENIRQQRKTIQYHIDEVRKEMAPSFAAAARSGTNTSNQQDFSGTKFPNGLPFNDSTKGE